MSCPVRVAISIVLVCLVTSVSSYSYEIKKLEDNMNEKFEIEFNEITRLNEALSKDRDSEQRGSPSKHGDSNNKAAKIVPVLVKKNVIDSPSGSISEFTVRYKLSTVVDPDVTWFTYESGYPQIDNVTDSLYDAGADGYVRETTARLVDDGVKILGLHLRLLGLDFFIKLKNRRFPHQFSLDVPNPTLTFEPLGDFVYTHGRDLIVKVISERQGNDDDDRRRSDFQSKISMILFDHVTGQVRFNQGDDENFLHFRYRKIYIDTEEMEIFLSTSDQPYSGLVTFGNDIRSTRDFIMETNVSTTRVLRSSNQTEPFPKGFIAFIPSGSESDANMTRTPCVSNGWARCLVDCTAVGNNLTDLSVQKIDETGKRIEVPYDTEVVLGGYGLRSRSDVFSSSQIGEQVTYVCEARDVTGNMTSIYSSFYIFALVTFDDKESGISFPTADTAVAVCVVKAAPVSSLNVTMDVFSLYDVQRDMVPSSVEQIPGGLNATLEVQLDPRRDPVGFHVNCKAEQTIADRRWPVYTELFLYPSLGEGPFYV